MLQQREHEYRRMEGLGLVPRFVQDWLQYLGTLDWNEAPCYSKLEGIIESAAWQQFPGRKRQHSSSEATGEEAGETEEQEQEVEQQVLRRWRRRVASCTLCDSSTLLQLAEE